MAARAPTPRTVGGQPGRLTAPELKALAAAIKAGSYGELEHLTRELLERYPDSGLLWKTLGATLKLQGKDALQALQQTAAIESNDAEAHFALGNALRQQGRGEDAVVSFREALRCNPDLAQAYNELGNALQELGRFEEAVDSYQRILALKPDFAAAHSNLGAALQSLGQIDQAVASYRRALEIVPTLPEAHNNLGNALRSLGKFGEAESSYRRALQINPQYAEAHNNLGNVLRSLGRSQDALESYRRALEITPSSPEPYNNLGNALRDLKQTAEAVASYRQALQLRPDYADAHINLGVILLESGDPQGAVASFRRASEIRCDAEAHNHLGNALRRLGRLDEAVGSYQRALQLKPDFAQAHGNLAGALRLKGRLLEAESSCRTALCIDPNLAPAIALLADFHADRGAFAESETLLKRAIALQPQFPQAWAGLALLRTFTHADAAWLTAVQGILSPDLPPHSEVYLRYAMGKYFDDVEDFGEAFGHYRRANELEKLPKVKHERPLLTKAVDQLISDYDHSWLARSRADANNSERPILIIGMPRSGTTLAEQILASHPAVFGAGELPFWETAMARYEASGCPTESNEGLLRQLSDDYLRLLETQSASALRVVDKMPGNFFFLGLIKTALPRARIIHMQRDPIDTCLSIYFQHFETAPAYTNDLEDLAHYYTEYRRTMNHWRSVFPADTILEVPYEGLVDHPEAWSRRILEFVGLAWDPRCLDFSRTTRTVVTASKWQVRQKITRRSVGRWRNYSEFIGPLRGLLDWT